jgi:hypothetical protein
LERADLLSTLQLEGVRTKVKRAQATLAYLKASIKSHCADEARRLEVAIKQQDLLAMDRDEPETLYEYSVVVGEVVHNLRSSLDHLVWQLVIANGGTPDRKNAFPIISKESDYRKQSESKLRGMTDGQRQTIEGVQPFGDNTNIGPHLGMLHAICNIDKHRHLNVVSTHSMVSAHVEGEVPAGLLPSSSTRGLALVGMLAGFGYEDLAKPDTVVDVCFEDPELESASPGYGSSIEVEGLFARPPVIPVLQSCVAAVDTVVEQLSGE